MSALPAPVFRLAPNRVWRTYLGGQTLDHIAGSPNPADSHFPEDWILSTTPARNAGRENEPAEGISRVETPSGTLLLTDFLDLYPEEILGPKHLARFGKTAGFLLKYLDSSIRLHMQCHPSIPFAQKFLNSNFGKTEGYTILGIRPGCEGYVYLGFQHAPTPDAFRNAILTQDSHALLAGFEKIPVHPGDCFYVPGGIPHAIGEGVFMIEMMEPTDFAVRVEFERGGYTLPESARFMGRDVDFAISMFDFTSRSIQETRDAFFVAPTPLPITGDALRTSLFDQRTTPCFRSERIQVHSSQGASVSHEGMRVLLVTHGSGSLQADNTSLSLHPYDRILVPASTPSISLYGNLELIVARPPVAHAP